MAIDFPTYGQQGLIVAPATVKSVWVRHDLEIFQKRLKVLESFMAQGDSPVLTESQVQTLEKQVEGEIETKHPGY